MRYTAAEVIQYVREEDVKFIRLAFCDRTGRQKNIAIMASELEDALTKGVGVDLRGVEGFSGRVILKPDADTIAELPWRPQHGQVAHFFCDIENPDGTPYEADARYQLKKAAEGRTEPVVVRETFYLLKLDENGEPTGIPHDRAGYLDIAPEDKGENVRREICLTLERMGIAPVSSRHEAGPGQHIIFYAPADAVTAADNAVTFRAVVRTIAAQYGLFADFSPRPIAGSEKNVVRVTVGDNTRRFDDTEMNPYLLVKECL